MGATQRRNSKAVRQLRLIYYPELENRIGARVSKGRRAIHRKMRRTDVW